MADDELQSWFRDMPYKLRREFAGKFAQLVQEFAGELREDAPVGKTGRTKQSVRVTRGSHSLELNVEAGGPLTTKSVRKGQTADYDYAVGGEFGNSHESAKAWFYPGFRRRREDWSQRVQQLAAETMAKAQ